MKNSITLLGMALLVFNMNATANTSNTFKVTEENEQGDFFKENNPLAKRNAAPVEDKTILNPATVMVNTEKSIEEIIAENNQITESKITDEGVRFFAEQPIETIIEQDNQIIESKTEEVRPLYLEKTVEDQIAEDNAIIESDMATVIQSLDFDSINKRIFTLKQSNKLVGMN